MRTVRTPMFVTGAVVLALAGPRKLHSAVCDCVSAAGDAFFGVLMVSSKQRFAT